MRTSPLYFFAFLGLILASLDAFAQLAERKVDIYSEGVRMTGAVFYPQALEGNKLPAIILSHGWGGTAAMLRPQAQRFGQAGYFVLVFDYRGWGESDSRWVRDESAASDVHARRELREVVDRSGHRLDGSASQGRDVEGLSVTTSASNFVNRLRPYNCK